MKASRTLSLIPRACNCVGAVIPKEPVIQVSNAGQE